eukprot:1712418-Prymnesium_polylepis.1
MRARSAAEGGPRGCGERDSAAERGASGGRARAGEREGERGARGALCPPSWRPVWSELRACASPAQHATARESPTLATCSMPARLSSRAEPSSSRLLAARGGARPGG